MVRIRCLSSNRGFTLVEALIASLIMAIGLFAMITTIYAQFAALSQNREYTIATLAAQEEIEIIRGMSFADILNLGSTFTTDGFIYLDSSSGALTVDNAYSPISGADNVRRISATVSWNSIDGKPLRKTMATLMTKDGINRR